MNKTYFIKMKYTLDGKRKSVSGYLAAINSHAAHREALMSLSKRSHLISIFIKELK